MRRSEKHLAEIEAELATGEQVVGWIGADDLVSATSMVPTVSGVLALTSTRFIFKGSSRKAAIRRELTVADARGLDVGWHRSAVDLRFDGNPEFGAFLARNVDLAAEFLELVKVALSPTKSSPADESPVSTFTDLAALGELFERGLLTADEFATAKSRLLG